MRRRGENDVTLREGERGPGKARDDDRTIDGYAGGREG